MNLDNLSSLERDIIMRMRAASGAAPAAPPGEAPAEGQRAWGEAPKPNPPTITRLKPPSEWVAKQIGNLQAVGETNYSAGIARPKKDPVLAGIAAQGAYEAKMRDPAVLKRRETGLRKTDSNEWAAMAETLGARRLVEGVVARRFKVERFVANWQPKLLQHLSKVDSLPNVTDADRERRMIENLKGLKALKGQA